MNLPDGVVGVVGAEEADAEDEPAAAAAFWEGPGVGLDCGLPMAAPPSVDPMVIPPYPVSLTTLTSATYHLLAQDFVTPRLEAIGNAQVMTVATFLRLATPQMSNPVMVFFFLLSFTISHFLCFPSLRVYVTTTFLLFFTANIKGKLGGHEKEREGYYCSSYMNF